MRPKNYIKKMLSMSVHSKYFVYFNTFDIWSDTNEVAYICSIQSLTGENTYNDTRNTPSNSWFYTDNVYIRIFFLIKKYTHSFFTILLVFF